MEPEFGLMEAMRLSLKITEQGGDFTARDHQGLNCRCSKTFAVPYLDDPKKSVIACAYCDSAIGWPRFRS